MTHAQGQSSTGGSIDQHLGAHHQQHQTEQALAQGHRQGRCRIVFQWIITGAFFAGRSHFPNQIDQQHGEQSQASHPGEGAGGGHAPGRHRNGQQQRHIPADQPALNPQWHHQGTGTEHHQQIEDVGADHIADSDAVNAAPRLHGRQQADKQFRRAGAKGDHRQTNDDLRDPKQQRQRHRARHKQLATGEQQGNPQQHLQKTQGKTHRLNPQPAAAQERCDPPACWYHR